MYRIDTFKERYFFINDIFLPEILDAYLEEHMNCASDIKIVENYENDVNDFYHLMYNATRVLTVPEAISVLTDLYGKTMQWMAFEEDYPHTEIDLDLLTYSDCYWPQKIIIKDRGLFLAAFDYMKSSEVYNYRKESSQYVAALFTDNHLIKPHVESIINSFKRLSWNEINQVGAGSSITRCITY